MVNIVDIEDAFGATLSLPVSVKKRDACRIFGSTVRADVTEVFQLCYCCR